MFHALNEEQVRTRGEKATVFPSAGVGTDEALRGRTMNSLSALNVKIYADGADKAGMLDLYRNPLIQGMTTNPTLMKKAGITDYEAFCQRCAARR